ncbi:hypothetical protein GGG16DRAFT_122409 [Schizophyllum commune]
MARKSKKKSSQSSTSQLAQPSSSKAAQASSSKAAQPSTPELSQLVTSNAAQASSSPSAQPSSLESFQPSSPKAAQPSSKSSGKSTSRKGFKLPEDQYYYEIPRAILKKYHAGPSHHAVEGARPFPCTGALADCVNYYDIGSRTLEKRSIDRAYVLKDLYRDASNPSEVVELQGKLAELEQHATRIFEDIHNCVPKGKLTLARSDLDEFRKYLFLVHFRRQVLGLSYYDKDRPEDVALRKRFMAYGEANGLQTPIDTWLHLLRYLLETPMDKIDAIGAAWMREQSMDSLLDNFAIDCDFAIDYFPAINFELQSQAYFVGFWEAAETDEFVLTPGAFGYWEGCLSTHPEFHLHRVFVISPRLAIVLRSDFMREGVGFDRYRERACSTLLDLPLSTPEIDFAKAGHDVVVDGEVAFTFRTMDDYNPAIRRKRDRFTMRIHKLTSEQTLAVNAATLRSTRPDGALAFTSRSMVVRTLRHYMHRTPIHMDMCWESYRALADRLARPSAPDTPSLARIGSFPHEETFHWLMDLVYETTRPAEPLPLYMCGAAVVRQLFRRTDARNTILAEECGRYAGQLVEHFRPRSVAKSAIHRRDEKEWYRPHTLDHDTSAKFIEAARPLLKNVVPACVCSAKSSAVDRILEVAVLVRFLDLIVKSPQLVAAFRLRCPSLFRWMHLCPHPTRNPKDCLDYPYDADWPPVHRDIRKKFDDLWKAMLRGEITFPNRYERGQALHKYAERMWKTPAIEGPITMAFALNMPVMGTRMVKEYFPDKPPGFKERPTARPRRNQSLEAGDMIMEAITDFIRSMGFQLFDEDGPHPDPKMAKMRQYANDLLTYGYLDFLARMRPDILEGIVNPHWSTFIEEYDGYTDI